MILAKFGQNRITGSKVMAKRFLPFKVSLGTGTGIGNRVVGF